MLNKIFKILFFIATITTNFLIAEVKYQINDIGTLQTKSSEAIAINNQGQILGWYNIDGSNSGKYFFLRDRDGVFCEIPTNDMESKRDINWRYLTDDGKVFGIIEDNINLPVMYTWDQKNGIVKLGILPGKEIVTINNLGQVLIKSITESENGRTIRRPVIWHNGQITKLKGLGGDLGIESEESFGFDMNNQGEVAGQSLVLLSYKNTLYTQIHATKWVNGHPIDLHNEVPKAQNSYGIAINDHGDVLVGSHLIRNDGQTINLHNGQMKSTDDKYFYKGKTVIDRNGDKVSNIDYIGDIFHYDKNSIWWSFNGITSMNDIGEIISQGVTVWGEQHAIILTPMNAN